MDFGGVTVFVIELHSRRVHVLGSTPYPDEAFVMQTLRQVTGDGYRTRRWHPDLRSRSEVESRSRACCRRRGHGPNAGMCSQLQRVRRTMCATTAQRGDRDVTTANSMQPCCTRDEGRPLGLGLQGQGPNHRERRRSNDRGRERLGKGGTYPSGVCWEDERE
jgi:hypothetical protein